MALPRFIRPHTVVSQEVVAEQETAPTVEHPVEVAARRFDEEKAALVAFIEANQVLFDQLDGYLERYNAAIGNMQILLKSGADLSGRYTGPFSTKKAVTSVTFDLAKLPAHVKEIPGVLTQEVDNKALSALIVSGRVKFSDVEAARKEETRSPAVMGPKPVEFKIT